MTEKKDESRDRVLFLTPQPYFQWRGSPIRVGYNVQALAESGFDVDLLAMPVGEDRETPGVRLLRVPNVLGVKELSIGPSLSKAVLDVFLFFKAWRLARKNRYAVIHGVEDAGILALFVARWTGARAVYEKHSDPASYKKGIVRNLVMKLYGKVEAFTIRRADAVIGTGPGLIEQAREFHPKGTCHHIFDIPSSLAEAESGETEKVRNELKQDDAEKLITYVGSFAVYQGIDLLFESIPLTVKKNPHARFVIIGGSPREIEDRSNELAARNVLKNVSFIGKVPPDRLPDYLSASDILVSPRIAGRNTPLKLLDYLKAGRAIVATDHESNRLILTDETAEWVSPDATSLSNGISGLLNDTTRCEQLGRNGGELIRQTYNFEMFKSRLAACYQGLLSTA